MSAEKTSSFVRGHTPPLARVAATTDMILQVACSEARRVPPILSNNFAMLVSCKQCSRGMTPDVWANLQRPDVPAGAHDGDKLQHMEVEHNDQLQHVSRPGFEVLHVSQSHLSQHDILNEEQQPAWMEQQEKYRSVASSSLTSFGRPRRA